MYINSTLCPIIVMIGFMLVHPHHHTQYASQQQQQQQHGSTAAQAQ
jgi:hypothetical protein